MQGSGKPYFALIPHSAHPPAHVTAVSVRLLAPNLHWLMLRWRIEGSHSLVVPRFAGRARADGLWRATCFELFLGDIGSEAYCEFNFSPSERWAAYDFAAYRADMTERPLARDPVSTVRRGGRVMVFDVAIPRVGLPSLPCRMGLSAVIEEDGGSTSYWALAHSRDAPDFHDPACFAATLAAPAGE